MYTDATGGELTYNNFGSTPMTGECAVINFGTPGTWGAGDCMQGAISLCPLVIDV